MIKSRSCAIPELIQGVQFNTYSGQKDLFYATPYSFTQSVNTGNHPDWINQDDGGGAFSSDLREVCLGFSNPVQVRNHNDIVRYRGSFTATLPGVTPPFGNGSLWGATAFKAMKPTNFDYSLLNMVYELRDLPRMLLDLQHFWDFNRFKRNWRRSTGQGFLGQVFGWNPLVNDVLTLIKKQQDMQKRIDWLLRNQGKWIPRRYKAASSQSRTVGNKTYNWAALSPVLVTQCYFEQPWSQDVVEVGDRVWATAQFKYFLPTPIPGVRLNSVVRRAMNGFRPPSAADLYRAIPWTWLVDWCLGMANVLENMDPGVADRVAARRFYIMREQYVYARRTASGVLRRQDDQPITVTASSAVSYTLKTRVRGSPFYPGNPNQLSGMQLAILGALGLSKY